MVSAMPAILPRLRHLHPSFLKRLLIGLAVLTATLAALLSSCSSSATPDDPTPTPGSSHETATPPPATPSPSPSPSPSPTPTPEPTPTPTPTPEPTPEPPPQAFLDLQATLEEQIAAHPHAAEIAVAVTDLQTGHTIHVNGDRPHLSGCVMNLFVIIETVRMAQDGELELADIESLVRATTWSSNAYTAMLLYGVAGGSETLEGVRRVAALLEELELDGSLINHPPGYGHISRGVDANNWVTALDTNRALGLLYHSELLDEEHTAFVLDAMSNVTIGLNYLTASGVPADVTVSHKNGFFPSSSGYIDNDIGIVRFERGGEEHAYAVSFYSQYNPYKLSQIHLAQTMMANIWDYFDEAYPSVE